MTLYGPERFTRGNGAPETVTRTIPTAGYQPPFNLHVRNGNADGTSRVSSGSVRVNGVPVLSASDFSQREAEWIMPVALDASATLEVRLASAPGSFLEIRIEGSPAPRRFCPGGTSTDYASLRDAVVATPSGGTVLVCDGDFAIDSVRIDRPLTLRAEHSGMATLRDAVAQRPAIVIDGIASGLVRITDLHFAVAGNAIVAGVQFGTDLGTWDRVEIDGVRFTGVGGTARPIRAHPSTVSTARMDIINSTFDNVNIGVFPSGGEVNVRSSTFTRSGSGITYTFASSDRSSRGTVENNVFQGCGSSGCIRVLGGGGTTVRNNRIESGNTGVAFNQFLNSGVITVQLNAAAGSGGVLVEGNTIVGRRNAAFPADQVGGYADAAGIVVGVQFPHPVIVRNNSISNTWIGLSLGGGATATIDARDNVLTGGAYAINRVNTVTAVIATRNDLIGFVRSIRGTNASIGSYRCNWWGTTAGPVAPEPQIPGTMYAPWAMQPVAGNASPCDPTPLQTALVCGTPSGTLFTVPAASQALSIVTAGGTVLFCDGTHGVANLNVTKSVTFAALGPGMPTIDAQSAFTSFNVNTPGTNVYVHGLRFMNANGHNIHVNNGHFLRVERSTFHPRESIPYNRDRFAPANGQQSGIGAFATFTRVEVESSTFLGGDAGIHLSPNGPAAAVVRGSTFRGQTNSGLFVASVPAGSSVLAEQNTFGECGRHGCVRAFRGGSDGTGAVTLTSNTFDVDVSRPVWSVVITHLGAGRATARNNRVIGTGIGAGTRHDFENYAIDGQAFQYSGHLALEGNVIQNAHAVATNVAPGVLVGANNTVARIAQMLNSASVHGSASATWQRNDATDVMQMLPYPEFFSSVSLRCNWWGSASGPTAAQAAPLPADVYTPFATAPIANEPAASCTP